MTDEERFQLLLKAFEGTPVEAILREMEEELEGPGRSFQLVHLILTRMEQISEMWDEERRSRGR